MSGPGAVAVVVAATIAAASCGGGSHAARVGSTVSTTMPSSPTGSTVPGVGSCSTPSDAARSFVDAGVANDRTGAGRCATPDAVATLFAHPGRAAGWTFQGCDGPDPGVPVCGFGVPGGSARLRLHGTEAAGWSVDQVEFATG